MKLHRFFLILALLPTLLGAVPDGEWNGKPWDPENLKRGVEAGDPEALAEWAYSSSNSLGGISYNDDLFLKRATIAAEAGSPIGMYVLGLSQIRGIGTPRDTASGAKHIREAAKHYEEAENYMAYLTLMDHHDGRPHAFKGLSKKNALRILEKNKDGEATNIYRSRAFVIKYGVGVAIDLEEYVTLHVKHFEKSSSVDTASVLLRLKADKGDRVGAYIPDTSIVKFDERLREAADLGHPGAISALGYIETEYGNPHVGVPAVIRSANLGWHKSRLYCAYWARNGLYNGNIGNYAVGGDITSSMKLAALLYDNGYESNRFIASLYARHLSEQARLAGKPLRADDKAADILRKVIADNRFQYQGYDALAAHLFSAKATREESKALFERYAAIHVYRSKSDAIASHWLQAGLRSWGNKKNKIRDLPRSIAAGKYATTRNNGKWLKAEKRWIAQDTKKLNKKQKRELKQLEEQGYPHARKFREEAFELLKKTGDIPEDWIFDDDLPNGGEGSGAMLIPLTQGELMLCAAPVKTKNSGDLMKMYFNGDPLTKADRKGLTSLLISEPKELRKLFQKHGKSHPDKLKAALEALSEETALKIPANSLGAEFGWYLIFENDIMTSIPIVNRLAKDSPAAKAGLKKADVVDTCNGVDVSGVESRNRFTRMLRLWPEGEPMEFDIRRSQFNTTNLNDAGWKKNGKHLVFEGDMD